MGSSHSGCAMSLASGWRSRSATILRRLKVSWTTQLPCQRCIGRPVFSISQRPRLRSGAKRISRPSGTARTIFSALDEVQM